MSNTQIRGSSQIQDATIPANKVDNTIIIAAGTNPFTGDQSMGSHKITSLATPTGSNDAANKAYVDSLVNGLDWKASVRVATTVNAALATAYENGDTVDGVVLATGDRILIKNQTTGAENGIYVVAASGAPTRASDADASAEVTSGLATFVSEGTVNGNTQWSLITDDPIVLGTTSLVFAQVGGSASYTADETSIHLTGTVFSAIFGTTAGTVCQGNDTRLSNARTPVGTALSSGQIFVGSAGNVVAAVAMSGDATIDAAGVVTLAATVIKQASIVTRETPSGAINGSNVTFTLANTPLTGTESVYLNGILQDAGGGNDYTISGVTITMLTAPISGDKLRVSYYK